jgi:tetratricopeptide (TPR) repeat protein
MLFLLYPIHGLAQCDNERFAEFKQLYEGGLEFYNNGEYSFAWKQFQKANKVCKFDEFYFIKGHCLDLVKNYEDAIKWYRKYVELNHFGIYEKTAEERIKIIKNGKRTSKRVLVTTSYEYGKADHDENEKKEGYWENKEVFEVSEPAKKKTLTTKPHLKIN